MIPYPDVYSSLTLLAEKGWYIIAVTARPVSVYKRIFKDTFYWFRLNHLPLDELHMLDSDRLLMANLLAMDNDVVLWEDDTEILTRANTMGITVFARRNSKNSHLNLANVGLLDSYYTVAKEME
jgi:hypothetical protein